MPLYLTVPWYCMLNAMWPARRGVLGGLVERSTPWRPIAPWFIASYKSNVTCLISSAKHSTQAKTTPTGYGICHRRQINVFEDRWVRWGHRWRNFLHCERWGLWRSHSTSTAGSRTIFLLNFPGTVFQFSVVVAVFFAFFFQQVCCCFCFFYILYK